MEVNIALILSWIISFILGIMVASLIVFIKKKKEKNKYDGIIIIDEADEDGHAGLSMEFNIEYDELIKRNYMLFEVKNYMSQNSQFVK